MEHKKEKKEIIITKENFEEKLEKLLRGCIEANNYNSECFSS